MSEGIDWLAAVEDGEFVDAMSDLDGQVPDGPPAAAGAAAAAGEAGPAPNASTTRGLLTQMMTLLTALASHVAGTAGESAVDPAGEQEAEAPAPSDGNNPPAPGIAVPAPAVRPLDEPMPPVTRNDEPPVTNTLPPVAPVAAETRGVPTISKWPDHGSAAHAEPWIDLVILHATRLARPVQEILVYCLNMEGLAWLHALLPTRAVWTSEAIKEAFMRRFGGQVRTPRAIALQKLMSRGVTQGTDSVPVYSERFLVLARPCTDMSPAALCHAYIQGLNAYLKQRCCFDLFGNEWSDLNALIQFAHVEAARAAVGGVPTRTPDDTSVPSKRPFGHNQFQKRDSRWFPRKQGTDTNETPAKKARTYANAAAVGGSNAPRNPGPSGTAGPSRQPRGNANSGTPSHDSAEGKGKGKPFGYLHNGNPVYFPIPNPAPNMLNCPAFGKKGPITPEQDADCRRFWLCRLCRTGQHPAVLCPNKDGNAPNYDNRP